jgi:hypothetical protein
MNEMPKPPDGFQPVKTKRIRKSGPSTAHKTENGYNTDVSSVSNYYNPLEDDDDMNSASRDIRQPA